MSLWYRVKKLTRFHIFSHAQYTLKFFRMSTPISVSYQRLFCGFSYRSPVSERKVVTKHYDATVDWQSYIYDKSPFALSSFFCLEASVRQISNHAARPRYGHWSPHRLSKRTRIPVGDSGKPTPESPKNQRKKKSQNKNCQILWHLRPPHLRCQFHITNTEDLKKS